MWFLGLSRSRAVYSRIDDVLLPSTEAFIPGNEALTELHERHSAEVEGQLWSEIKKQRGWQLQRINTWCSILLKGWF